MNQFHGIAHCVILQCVFEKSLKHKMYKRSIIIDYDSYLYINYFVKCFMGKSVSPENVQSSPCLCSFPSFQELLEHFNCLFFL